jgi:hypothetical protein
MLKKSVKKFHNIYKKIFKIFSANLRHASTKSFDGDDLIYYFF